MIIRSILRRIGVLRFLAGMTLASLFIYPISRFLLLPWFPALAPIVTTEAIESPLPVAAIVNSLGLALGSMALAVPAGIILGWLRERRRWTGNAPITIVIWMLFFTPSYILTTGWEIVFSTPLLHHTTLAGWFFGIPGITFLLGLKGLPFATLAARSSWAVIGGEIDDALQIHVLSRLRRLRILIGLLIPAAGSAGLIVLIESLQEFGIPATLGAQIHLPILTYAIYERLATVPVDFSGAASLSWVLILLVFAGAAINMAFLAPLAGQLAHGRSRSQLQPPLRAGPAVLASVALLLLATLGILAPGSAIVTLAVVGNSGDPLPVDWASLGHSTVYGASAALVAATSATALATSGALRPRYTRIFWEIFSLANMAVPGLVLGAAYLIAFNTSWLPLYGTPLLLVMAYVASQVPMLIRFLAPVVSQIHPSLGDAARVHGMPWAERIMQIHCPNLATPFLWGWAMSFGQVFFELPVSELLYPPGEAPAAVALVNMNQQLDYCSESRVALAGLAICLMAAAVASYTARALQGRHMAETRT